MSKIIGWINPNEPFARNAFVWNNAGHPEYSVPVYAQTDDTARLDWLEAKAVRVYEYLPDTLEGMFTSLPESEGTNDIRARIDVLRKAGL